ncbi:MAG: hypothetical protein KGN34_06935 [Sphingomonadales bacterium]|nr:hypothetical protein [Sphingomonadales bacterium]
MAEQQGVPPPLPNKLVFTLLAAFCAVALLLRASTFGNPNLLADDAFYALVGQRMHDGLLPYVDVWDRKPFGLFAIYWAIAAVSHNVIAYQLAATAAAAMTALVVFRLVLEWAPPRAGIRAGVLAALAYLFALGPFDGMSGQAPVFYNFAIALAAWLVWRAHAFGQTSRLAIAAALCGCALTVKQTTLFESAFLLGFGLWTLHRQGKSPLAPALKLGVIAAAPMLAITAAYAMLGHWPEFYHAMITANLAKAPLLPGEQTHQAASLAVRIAIPLALALWGLAAPHPARPFLIGWLLAGLVGVLVVPNFFPHYALPWLVPLSCAAGLAFARTNGAAVAFALVVLNAFTWYDPFDRAWNRHAIASTDALASAVVHHDGGRGLFVYDGPVLLYAMTGRPFPSPLVFPHHLNQLIERNVSHLDTDAEVARVLARHPGAVVTTLAPRNFPVNRRTWDAVQAYVAANCRRVALVQSYDHLVVTPTAVYGDCRRADRIMP